MRHKVIDNKGSLKQLEVGRVLVLVNIDFPPPTSKSKGTRWGNKKKCMYDNARRKIKMQIKKREKTYEPVFLVLLRRAEIFWARPTHLNLTPRYETRKSVVYQLARTCTQKRPCFKSRNSTPATFDPKWCRFICSSRMLEKFQIFYDRSKQMHIEICRIFWNCYHNVRR